MSANAKLLSCLWLLCNTFCPICFLFGLWLISVRRCKNSRALCTPPCCFFLFALHDIDQACSWASYLFLRPNENQETRGMTFSCHRLIFDAGNAIVCSTFACCGRGVYEIPTLYLDNVTLNGIFRALFVNQIPGRRALAPNVLFLRSD